MADKRRRKSLSVLFHKTDQNNHKNPSAPATPTSPIHRANEDFTPASPIDIDGQPKVRPRTLQKPTRTSVFGSLRSLHSLDEEEKTGLTRSDSKSSSIHEDVEAFKNGLFGHKVIKYGEVQTMSGSVFRKKSQFMVLTESHLIRFKSQGKAVEMFSNIPSPIMRSNSRMSSVGSYHEMQMSAYQDITTGLPLEHIVAVYKLDDGRPFFTVEVSHLDERAKKSSAMQLALNEPREAELWMTSIRDAAKLARSTSSSTIQQPNVDYVTRVVQRGYDYHPEHFHIFKVAQRASSRTASRTSAEDLTKLNSTICYLAIGLHNVHLIPMQRAVNNRSSSSSLNEMDTPSTFGITTLTSVKTSADEDSFQLTFKPPHRQPHVLRLASTDAGEIALWLRFSSEYLRPQWSRQPFVFDVPAELDDQMDPPAFPQEDYNCFDRTLIAYCAAYEVDTSRICYTVDPNCEDAPSFQLLPAADGKPYTALELLAVFRSLRYNEAFVTISFANIDLGPIRFFYDAYVTDIDSICTRSGTPLNLAGHHDLPILCQEIRALAMKSRKLRRFDFSQAFPGLSLPRAEQQSCGVFEALAPLCKKSLTNVDWIVLNGVRLADSDVDFLVDAASQRTCHFRALEVGDSGLSVHDIDVLLSTMSVQDNTMEVINISGAQGRFSPEIFQREIGAFSHIRRLNLTRVQKTAGPEPLIAPETLMTWRLEALYLSQTTLNEQTIESISAYLASPRSEILRELHLNQCGLSGKDLAVFFEAMTRQDGRVRNMHISANENRLKLGREYLVDAISKSYGPSSLTMRMMDFEKEHHFRDLILAITSNTSLRSLDISGASLPYDANEETCEVLKDMFARNMTLEELDISGEHVHLDATPFGIGLNTALRGLDRNSTLKVLRIEHQNLGLQGATTLATVLEKNQTLVEIYCEHNDINLQSFTVLVNAIEKNKSLLYLPTVDDDRARSMENVRKEFESADKVEEPKHMKSAMAVKKTLSGALAGRTHRAAHRASTSVSSNTSFTEHDATAVMFALSEKWDAQVNRLQRYLYRNYCYANNIPWNEEQSTDRADKRESLAESSLHDILEKVKLERTPNAKNISGFNFLDEKLVERSPMVFEFPED